jgi:hypothetical protein
MPVEKVKGGYRWGKTGKVYKRRIDAVKQGQAIKAQGAERGLAKGGLWANIHAKRKRIEQGSGEKMRKPGSKGAPTAEALKKSAMKKGGMMKKGYAQGGMVNCGASMKPNGKSRK